MVTLLIEDRRLNDSPVLVEVKVPLRHVPGTPDFYWADAQDISRTLQESAARVDGTHSFILNDSSLTLFCQGLPGFPPCAESIHSLS
jgi:hypothetical protein